jgi:transcriptional regulator with XRE-family HTH domain
MKKKAGFDSEEVGKRLKQVRETLSLTLTKMEEYSGLSKSQVSAVEKGEKKPSSIYLSALIKQFDININFIFTGKGDMFLHPKNKTAEEKDIDELFQMMKQVKMLKYAVLGFFHEYKKRNEDILKDLINDNDDKFRYTKK